MDTSNFEWDHSAGSYLGDSTLVMPIENDTTFEWPTQTESDTPSSNESTASVDRDSFLLGSARRNASGVAAFPRRASIRRRRSSSSTTEDHRSAILVQRIEQNAAELAEEGIDERDLNKLASRLALLWGRCSPRDSRSVTGVTKWRNSVARTTYAYVQSSNPHMLLPVILAVPPSECSTPALKAVLPELLRQHRYQSYRLAESTVMVLKSIQQKELKSSYERYIQSIFPQRELASIQGEATIHEAQSIGDQTYSAVTAENLPTFLRSILSGVQGSVQAMQEMVAGESTTNCVKIFVPLNAADCLCSMVISRDTAARLITEHQLSRIPS